jgi:hypothetical protein
MSTIEGASPTNPAEVPDLSPQRVARVTIYVHNWPHEPAPPTALIEPAASRTRPLAPRKSPAGGRHRLDDSPWLDLLERVLTSWPITLRVTVLLVVLVTGTAAVAATLGIGGQLLLGTLGLHARRGRRRRLSAMRRTQEALEGRSRHG